MDNIRTFRYSTGSTGWAKIFSVKTTDFDVNHNQNAMMYFRLYHGQTADGMYKDYYIYASVGTGGNNVVILKDLTPDILGIECIYTIENNLMTVYVKGSIVGTYIHLKVLHSNVQSFFKFYNMETFTTELKSDVINYPKNDNLIQTKAKRSLNTLLVSPGNQVGYFKIGEMYTTTVTQNVALTLQFTELGGMNEAYSSGFVSMRVRKEIDRNDYKMAISFLENDENTPKVSFHLVENGDKVEIYVYIDMAYRSVLITPITYNYSSRNSVLSFLDEPTYVANINPAASASHKGLYEIRDLQLQNGWSSSANGFYNIATKIGGQVTIIVNAQGGTANPGTVIATSPFKPPVKGMCVPGVIKVGSEIKTCLVNLYSSGNIQLSTGINGAETVSFELTYYI